MCFSPNRDVHIGGVKWWIPWLPSGYKFPSLLITRLGELELTVHHIASFSLLSLLLQVLGFPSSNPLPSMAEFRSWATGPCWSSTSWRKTAATTCARSATMWARTSASPCTSRSKVRKKNALFYLNRSFCASICHCLHTTCLETKQNFGSLQLRFEVLLSWEHYWRWGQKSSQL